MPPSEDDLQVAGEPRPINWTAPPLPAFFWGNADAFKRPWRPDGTPELDKAGYGPLRGRAGTEAALRAQITMTKSEVLDTLRPALPFLKRNIEVLGLLERTRPYTHPILRAAGGAG